MTTLRIEHAIHDYKTWKQAFDRDPADRRGSGVRRYAIHQPIDDEKYIFIDLEFDSVAAAEALLATMRKVWRSSAAAPALAGEPRTRITDVVEAGDL
ncbi:MAG: hypothetical protein ABJA81_09420 [Nocardioidaceae bacterium]